jgi:hypothetical protein
MKLFQMVALTNVLFVVVVALVSMLWPMIGALVGYANSWWVAPLAAFCGFLIAGLLIRGVDLDRAFKAQLAIFGVYCFGTLLYSALIRNLGIPAWRVLLTLVLFVLATKLAQLALGRIRR